MIDLQSENTLPLNHARNLDWLKGRAGGRISIDALRRWSLRGLRGAVLETVRIGGTTYTSTEALQRFLEQLNRTDRPEARPTAQRQRALAKAGQDLDDLGV